VRESAVYQLWSQILAVSAKRLPAGIWCAYQNNFRSAFSKCALYKTYLVRIQYTTELVCNQFLRLGILHPHGREVAPPLIRQQESGLSGGVHRCPSHARSASPGESWRPGIHMDFSRVGPVLAGSTRLKRLDMLRNDRITSSYFPHCCCRSPHAAEIWAPFIATTLWADAAEENRGIRPSTSVG
jgi:hypothetical protein